MSCSGTFPDSSKYDIGSPGHDSKPRTSKYEPQDLSSTPLLSVQMFKKPLMYLGTAVAQWLGCCATIRKVAGSIPAGVSGLFIDIKSF